MPIFGPILQQLEGDLTVNLLVKSEALRLAGKMGNANAQHGYPGITIDQYKEEFAQFLALKESSTKPTKDALLMAKLQAKISSLEEAVDYGIAQLGDNCPAFSAVSQIIERATKNVEWCGTWVEPSKQAKNDTAPNNKTEANHAERVADALAGESHVKYKGPPHVR